MGNAMAAQGTVLRDPTRPPPEWGPQPAPARSTADAFRPEHLVVIDGRRYVMWRGRRYREGESIGGARIERIDEAEVWLRTAEGVRKLPVFAGIEKRAPGAGAPATTSERPDATKGKQQ
jgi:hypothetical protein